MSFESNITSSIIKYLNGLPECIAEKVEGNSRSSGRADINGCYMGRSFRIEVKSLEHKNKPSRKQEINLRKWRRAGSVTMVAYTLQDVKAVFTSEGLIEKDYSKVYLDGCRAFANVDSWKSYSGSK
ncbi:hypothetical protein D3C73_1168360 [compost metagenome]